MPLEYRNKFYSNNYCISLYINFTNPLKLIIMINIFNKFKLLCIGLPMFVGVLLSSCNKTELINSNEEIKPVANLGNLKAAINPSANAGIMYDGFVNSFVVNSGGQTYIVDGLNKRDRAYFWGQAFMITGLIDGYERVQNSDRKQRVINLTNSFLNQETYDWSWNSWTDDIAWACIAVIRAYRITGDNTYLTVAKNNWDFAYNRGWDNVLGGGLWENMDKHTKASLANNPMIIAGCFIYEATGNVWYLDRCKEIYAWFRSSGIYDTNSGNVNEAKVNDGSIQYSDNAYNDGSFINAAASLYKITRNSQYLDDAKRTANHVKSRWPVFNQEADACVRGIAKLARENGLESTYYPWLVTQCENAWNNRNTGRNITNNNWTAVTGSGEQYSMQCISAVTVWQVTPESGGGVSVPNGTYRVINRGSGKALDCRAGGTANNTVLVQTTYSGANRMRWTLTSLGSGQYKLINVASGRSIDVSGASTADNAALILWDYTGANNQRITFTSPASGYYVMTFVHSGKAADVPGGSTADNVALVQYGVNNGNNQQWQFLAP
jgi:predicted alpha-1,6-mannanase (GH76 family)